MALKKKTSKKTSVVSLPAWALILFGTLFGYFLSKSRATDFDTILNMFLFTDTQLYGVIAVAVAVIALGLFVLGRKQKAFAAQVRGWDHPPLDRKRLIGAFVFGAGWALAGICPGTVFTQLGEGKLSAFFALAGVFAGVWVFLRVGPRLLKK